jgi:hypothetical protein
LGPNLSEQEDEIVDAYSITGRQIVDSILAILAFLPITVCTGYITGWFTNLHGFRQRSLVERIFWSLPLSLAISAIASFLIGRYFSLKAVEVFLIAASAIWLALLIKELIQTQKSGDKWNFGFCPLGGKATALAIAWSALVILFLVDIQTKHGLFFNIAILDEGFRIGWIQSVIHTGIPPLNPGYLYGHPAAMRSYYFWYILSAAIARLAHLPAHAVMVAGCVWTGFALAALVGLYLKYFLTCGVFLRRRFIRTVLLFLVSGFDILVVFWIIFALHKPPLADIESWSKGAIITWLHTILWAPNHVLSLICCMFALLLAWIAGTSQQQNRITSVALIAATLASSFGLSAFVTLAFFMVMVVWAVWQIAFEHKYRPALLLAAGGCGSLILLIPLLWQLAHGSSGMEGGSFLSFAVREMIPPESLLASPAMQPFAAVHPWAARNLANLILLAPSYILELGFFLVAFIIFLVPSWRGPKPTTAAHRTLLIMTAAMLPIMSFVRSGVLVTNDFGWRAALFVQFTLVLLASELMASWDIEPGAQTPQGSDLGPHRAVPRLVRSVAALALVIGVFGTVYEALMLRFFLPIAEASLTAGHDPSAGAISHNALISSIGYAQLDRQVDGNAVLQYNPDPKNQFWAEPDWVGVKHQIAIVGDKPWCGAELGGDPHGCLAMASAIDALYNNSTAEQAQSTCRQIGIQYLIARVYDPVWKQPASWVWTLRPVVADAEFRALDCR